MTKTLAAMFLASAVAHAAPPAVGDRMPALDAAGKLALVSGPAAATSGKVVVLSFFALWCPGCRNELPFLKALDERFAVKGLQVVTVSIDKPEERFKLDMLIRKRGIAHTVLADPDERLKRVWQGQNTSLPYLVLVDRKGVVRLIEEGFDPKHVPAIAKQVEALLDEKAPAGK